jgi:hypothetical protein
MDPRSRFLLSTHPHVSDNPHFSHRIGIVSRIFCSCSFFFSIPSCCIPSCCILSSSLASVFRYLILCLFLSCIFYASFSFALVRFSSFSTATTPRHPIPIHERRDTL